MYVYGILLPISNSVDFITTKVRNQRTIDIISALASQVEMPEIPINNELTF